MNLRHDRLSALTAAIFRAGGCQDDEAQRVAAHLVEANLVGHDSHGVIRVATYVQWLRAGKVFAGRTIQIVFENEVLAVVDGQFGLGQTVGEQAMRLGIESLRCQLVHGCGFRSAMIGSLVVSISGLQTRPGLPSL